MTLLNEFESTNLLFNRLIKLNESRLKQHALRLTKHKDDAEDLYQDTLIKVFMNIEKLTEERQFCNWAIRIMHNIFLDKIRLKSRRPATTSFDDLSEHYGVEVDFEDKSVDIESEFMIKMINDMNSRQIRNMINTLNPKLRETISMSTYATVNPLDIENSQPEGMTYQAISKEINLDSGTVRSRLHRARNSLQNIARDADLI